MDWADAGKVCFYNERGEIKVNGYMTLYEAQLNAKAYGLEYVFVDANEVTEYIKEGVPHPRPEMGAYLSGDKLKGVVKGTKVTIDGKEYEADGSAITLSFSLPGTYRIQLQLWPYQDQEVTVETTS